MCGRYLLKALGEDVAAAFNLGAAPLFEPRYNVSPGQTVPVVVQEADGRHVHAMHWGLIPSWAKDPKIGYRMLNARCETLAEKPSFRAAFKRRRCLVPADGFYEWKKDGKVKQPFLIQPRAGLWGFAGLWETWTQEDGTPLESCTIITTEANDVVRPLHDRMPVIIDPCDYEIWLAPKELTEAEAHRYFLPHSPADTTATAVDPWVNNARHEGPRCIEHVAID